MNDRDLNQFVPQNGMDVIGADGEKIGGIDGVEREYFVVRKGFFFPQDHYIPMTAISSYDDNAVYLNVTKDEALEQEWHSPPAGGVDTTTTGDQDMLINAEGGAYGGGNVPPEDTGTIIGDSGEVGVTQDRTAAEYAPEDTLAGIDTTDTNVDDRLDYAANVDNADRDLGVERDREDQTIDVHQEELVAGTHPVERGEVRVNKRVVEEEQSLDVPVTEEEVNVTRRRVDRPATVDDHAFEEGTIEVPLRGEDVDVEKRNRVVEEVDIDKTARTRTEHVSDTVRREEVDVEGDNVDIENTTPDQLDDTDSGTR
ncbi:MAG TPA: DUF2382 domain-containing protein [Thermomicrobiales bacterium]|nr:DUF2382 domain-containing protein [Thermomicrobiales bacterium]